MGDFPLIFSFSHFLIWLTADKFSIWYCTVIPAACWRVGWSFWIERRPLQVCLLTACTAPRRPDHSSSRLPDWFFAKFNLIRLQLRRLSFRYCILTHRSKYFMQNITDNIDNSKFCLFFSINNSTFYMLLLLKLCINLTPPPFSLVLRLTKLSTLLKSFYSIR